MTETFSIRIDTEMKKLLEALAKSSKSFPAAEAITACVESEAWQLEELRLGIVELEAGRGVGHEKVSKRLKSWGQPDETKAPRGELSWSDERFGVW